MTRALALLLALAAGPVLAGEGPRPPCDGEEPFPAYAALGALPEVGVWTEGTLDDPGLPHVRLVTESPPEGRVPPCTDWAAMPFTIAMAARFAHGGGVETLLSRLGAVSGLAGLDYWRAARGAWEPLFEDAYAVADPETRERRPDHTAAELGPGRDAYSFQDIAGPVGGAVYRLRVLEAGPDRLVAEVENVTSARVMGLFPLRPGTLRFLHVLDRLPEEGVWGYYGLMGLATKPDSARTYVNRAAALYRQIAGIPDREEPPVWP